ncbi:hypothetical protein HDK64DRAFT_278701 [Phyllosticta capitalensis]|uniref:Uncharacterized protein n=1 Tax=Phyllosticta capitalensis TaxID=121624 RepID=A0ABR1YFN4_9PEZI
MRRRVDGGCHRRLLSRIGSGRKVPLLFAAVRCPFQVGLPPIPITKCETKCTLPPTCPKCTCFFRLVILALLLIQWMADLSVSSFALVPLRLLAVVLCLPTCGDVVVRM